MRHATVMHANTFDREMAASGGGGLPNQRYATGLHDAVVSMTATFTEGEEWGDGKVMKQHVVWYW